MPAAERQPMSKRHKEALARGREEGRSIRNYLEVIEHQRPRRGRKRTAESIRKRLAAVKEELTAADALSRLHLLQEQSDLQDELGKHDRHEEAGELEKAFVKVAKSYSERKGISYNAWRAAGVPQDVLAKAGIVRQ